MTAQPSPEDELLGRANEALAAADQSMADKLYEELVTAIEEVRGKNQKEVAAELQRLARAIEADGRLDDSMRLKQRTCEVMLRMSMAERHRGRSMPVMARSASPVISQSPSPMPLTLPENGGLRKLAFLYIGSHSPSNELTWLRSGLGASEIKRIEDNGRYYILLALPNSAPVLVCEDELAGAWLPVFEVDNTDTAIEHVRAYWPDLLREEGRLPGGKLTWLRSHTRRFGVVASSCLRGFIL